MAAHPDPHLTFFAEAERATPEAFERQRRLVESQPLVGSLLDSFPEPVALLNRQRQIVLASQGLAQLTERPAGELLGQRMGEAIGCEYSREVPNGCGTTPACIFCGAAQAIHEAAGSRAPAEGTCRITLGAARSGDAMDFDVRVTPVTLGDEAFLVFAIHDTSAEQRRRVLERMFFHDLLNAAGGLRSLLRILPEAPAAKADDLMRKASGLAGQLVEEIQAQRDLAAAERHELQVRSEAVDIVALLEDVVALYRHHSAADRKALVLDARDGKAPVTTDPVLLRRVMGNLVKNALEASRAGTTVTVRYRHPGIAVLEVHNEGVIPEAARTQIFHRSFSTKDGVGRGVGTYSARLLTERYLGGALTFSSEEGRGTTFIVTLP